MSEEETTIDRCQLCHAAMDVSGLAPFSSVICPSCGQQTRIKTQFGPYTLVRRHAVGGMSMVFAAHDSALDREIIVKILSEEYSQDEVRIAAFEQEARLTASFSHPNVVRVLRTGKAFGRFYIAMEFVSGGHFEHHIRERGRIPEAELLPLAIEVAQGLKAAQAAGLIHRDVKPGNIMLDADGRVRLVDFGLALVTLGGKATATELWATPFYVPPETMEGKEEDFRSDIYALGATLYHALAGVPPCNEQSMSTDVLLKAKQAIIPLAFVAPDLTEDTCEIITKMMAYHPQDRYASYDELIQQLKRSLTRLQNGRSTTVSRHHLRKFQSSPRLWIPVLAVLALTVSGGLFWLLRNGTESTETNAGNSSNATLEFQPVSQATEPIETIETSYKAARSAINKRYYDHAAKAFHSILENPAVEEPSRSYAGIEATICYYLTGNTYGAATQAVDTLKHLGDPAGKSVGSTQEFERILGQIQAFPAIHLEDSDKKSGAPRLMAAMLAGLKNWEQGMLDDACKCFEAARNTSLAPEEEWASIYHAIAMDYLSDYQILSGPLFTEEPKSPEECAAAIDALSTALPKIKTRGRASFNIKTWQLELARQAAILRTTQASNKGSNSPTKNPEQ